MIYSFDLRLMGETVKIYISIVLCLPNLLLGIIQYIYFIQSYVELYFEVQYCQNSFWLRCVVIVRTHIMGRH
jgi:hypothetical protein